MKQQRKRYKRIATGIVTSAAVVTIGAGAIAITPSLARAADGVPTHQHAKLQRKAPAWRPGLRAAEAKALGMSTEELKEARRTKQLDQLIKEANLSFEQFRAKVKDELTANWKAEGVSDKEISARLAKLEKHQHNRQHRWEKRQK